MTGRPRKPGAMGPFIEGYRAWLTERGYSPGTVIHLLAMAGGLGRWMDIRGIALAIWIGRDSRSSAAHRRVSGMRWVPGARGLDRLLEFLEQQGVLVTPVPAGGPVEELVDRYRRWLVERTWAGRGHGRAVCETGAPVLDAAYGWISVRLEKLTGTDIVAFLLQESERLSVGSVKGRVAELRSLLRFLYLQGLTPRPLSHRGAAGGGLA